MSTGTQSGRPTTGHWLPQLAQYGVQLCDARLLFVMLRNIPASGTAHVFESLRMLPQRADDFRHFLQASSGAETPPIACQRLIRVDRQGDDRTSELRCLQERVGETFPIGCIDHGARIPE